MRNHKLQIESGAALHADRIERQIDIDAPIEVVWNVITQPEHITVWFTDTAELDLRPGGAGRLGWDAKARTRPTVVNLQVERIDPPHHFSFRWGYDDGDDATETNAPLVEFNLEARGSSTRLHLVESGLGKIDRSDDEKQTYFTSHSSGWDTIAERLRDYAPTQRSTVAG